MNSLLVFAWGMADSKGQLPAGSVRRLEVALSWVRAHPDTTIYTAAYIPPDWPEDTPSLAVTMERYLTEHGAEHTRALTSPTHFNTRGEIINFLPVATGDIMVVSSRTHLPRIFCYFWELKGWRYARAVTYVPVNDSSGLSAWWLEFQKLCVIALPQPLQRRIEFWYAKRTHTYLESR